MLEQQQPEILDDGLSLEQVRRDRARLAGVFVVWCSLALVFAGFAMARRDWARRGLMVSAAFSAGACLLVVLSTPLLLHPGRGGHGDGRLPASDRGPALVRSSTRADPRSDASTATW